MGFIKEFGENFSVYPIYQRIFLLLPFRHQRKTDMLDFVMKHIKNMDSIDKIEQNIVTRFHIATIKDYSKVTDTIVHLVNDSKCRSHLFLDHHLIEDVRNVLDDICLTKYLSMDPLRVTDDIKETDIYT